MTSSQLLVDEGGQLGFAHGADFGGCKLAVFEQHQSGNASDAKFAGDVAVFVDVHFGDLEFAVIGLCHFVQDGGNHLAGATPLCPVIHQDRAADLQHFGFNSGVGDVLDQVARLLFSFCQMRLNKRWGHFGRKQVTLFRWLAIDHKVHKPHQHAATDQIASDDGHQIAQHAAHGDRLPPSDGIELLQDQSERKEILKF